MSYKCGICSKTLGKAFLNFGGTRYHYDCFVCFKCGTPLKDDVYAKDGRIYCKKDLPKGPAPEPVAPPPSAYTYTGEEGDGAPPPPPEEDDSDVSDRNCMVCKGAMKVDSWVVVDDNVVHKKCFFCSACGMGLKGVPYYVKGGALICEHDYKWSKGNDDRSWMCAGCHKIIHDNLVVQMSKKWHRECLKCSKAGCKNGAQFMTVEKGKEILYCSTHIPEGAEIEVQQGTKEEAPEEEAVVEEEQDLPLPTRPSVAPSTYGGGGGGGGGYGSGGGYGGGSAYKSGGGGGAYKSAPSASVSSASPYSSGYKSKPSVVAPPAPEEEEPPPEHSFDDDGDLPPPADPEPEPEYEPEPEPEPKAKGKPKASISVAPKSGGKSGGKAAADSDSDDDDKKKKTDDNGVILDTRKLDSAKKQLAARDSAKARLKAQLGDDAPKYKPSYKVSASKFEEEQQKTGKPKKK